MTIPPAVLDALLRDRPAPAHERIKRTVTATRIAGGWSCVWSSADGLGCATQIVEDEELTR